MIAQLAVAWCPCKRCALCYCAVCCGSSGGLSELSGFQSSLHCHHPQRKIKKKGALFILKRGRAAAIAIDKFSIVSVGSDIQLVEERNTLKLPMQRPPNV